MSDPTQCIKNCTIGQDTKIWHFVNLFGCTIGQSCTIGSFVEIQQGALVGNKVKVGSHSFICTDVTIEDEVFIGHHVVFTNDKIPRSTNPDGTLKGGKDWTCTPTRVEKGASIGSGSTIVCGITIGKRALVGAGSVVTHDVPNGAVVVGNPARPIKKTQST